MYKKSEFINRMGDHSLKYQFDIVCPKKQIHVAANEIPRPREVAPVPRRRVPRRGRGSCMAPWRFEQPRKAVRHRLAAPPATEIMARRTSLVRQDSAETAVPKIVMGMATGSPKNQPSGLETQGAAKERPSRRGDPDTPVERSGRMDEEAASWE